MSLTHILLFLLKTHDGTSHVKWGENKAKVDVSLDEEEKFEATAPEVESSALSNTSNILE